MVIFFGGVAVERFRSYERALINLILFCISSSWGLQVRTLDEDFECFQDGNFSSTFDCRTFFTCHTEGPSVTSQCSDGYSFDALERRCLPSQHVDCSKHHFPNHVRESGGSHPLNKKIMVEGNLVRRRRQTKVKTKPWGVWVVRKYIPYIVLWTKTNTTCIFDGRGIGLGDTNDTTPSSPSLSATIAEDMYENELITDIDSKENDFVPIFGHIDNIKYKPYEINKKIVHFLSDDTDAGAADEVKIEKLVRGQNSTHLWTQLPNADFTLSGAEEIEVSTQAAGPWSYTRLFKTK